MFVFFLLLQKFDGWILASTVNLRDGMIWALGKRGVTWRFT